MVVASFFARLYRRFLDNQSARADREIAKYRHLLPSEMERTGDRLMGRTEDALPFGS